MKLNFNKINSLKELNERMAYLIDILDKNVSSKKISKEEGNKKYSKIRKKYNERKQNIILSNLNYSVCENPQEVIKAIKQDLLTEKK